MSIFKGLEIYSIDPKGRVNVPAKMRKCISPEANDTFTIIRGKDGCIEAYPMDKWEMLEEKLSSLNLYKKDDRFFLRKMLRWAEEVTIDKQQRIILPKKLVELAGIDKKVLITGVVDHIEFWNPDTYDEYMDARDETFEEIAAGVMTDSE